MRRSLLLLTAAALMAIGAPIAHADVGRVTHATWFVRKLDQTSSARIYRRWSFQPDGNVPNILMYNCPYDRTKFAHLTIATKSILSRFGAPAREWRNVNARFLVNGGHAFSLPGEVINQDYFFDRTPTSRAEIHALLSAREFTVRLGAPYPDMRFVADPRLAQIMRSGIEASPVGPVEAFSTEEMLRDCGRLRRES